MKNKLGVYFSPSSRPHGSNYNYKYTATIDLENPLTISPTNKASTIYPELKELMKRPEESKNWTYEERTAYDRDMDNKYDTKLRELLLRDWYDWVIMLDDKWDVSQYVVLDPNKINIKNKQSISK